MQHQSLTRYFFWFGLLLLPAMSALGQGACNPLPGITHLAVYSTTDTSVTFRWDSVVGGRLYQYAVTNDSSFTGYTGNPNFVYFTGYTPDTFATVSPLQPGTKYWIFAGSSQCPALDSLSFVTPADPCRRGVVPVPTITSATGSFTLCGGSGAILLTSSSPSGNSWFLNGQRIDSGATSWLANQSGNYSLIVLYPNGCKDTSVTQAVVLDPGPPTPVVTASGNTEICKGSSVTLSSSAGSGNQWYEGNKPLPGETGAAYLADSAGVYWVQVTDGFGCWANSAQLTVTLNPASTGHTIAPTISPAGPLTICADSTVLLISSAAVNYQWFWDGDAIAGQTGDTLAVTVTGTYTVATGTAGCGSVGTLSVPVGVTYVDQLQPTISIVNGVLVSSFATGNQWYLNNSIIRGATNQHYTPRAPGSYTVRVGVGVQAIDTTTFQIGVGGCYSQWSAPWVIADSDLVVPTVLVYPNPAFEQLTLMNKRSGPVTVRIFDLIGQQVFGVQNMVGTVQVDVGRWGKGAYFVQVIDQGSQLQSKTVVLKL